jgi:tetratricopeptide (TPR) repeat protein
MSAQRTSEGRLRELFDQASELSPGERERFLQSSCAGDGALLKELRELLAADAAAMKEEFWQHSAIYNQAMEDHSADSAVGEKVGQYRLVELIGIGGMGSVYRAVRVDAEFEKSVAVKLISATIYSPDVIAHFRAERQILANLEHPNIARLLDGGARADGLPYLIMEFVEGTSPGDYCSRQNLSIHQRLDLFRQICSAVHYAHQNMVIHRDLKPANILVTSQGIPKLLDFGIAKVLSPVAPHVGDALTHPGMLKMTVRYSSPEQIRGESVTTSSDVYSLGVILYELLTGHSPYGDADRPLHQIMAAVCDEEPAKPSAWVPKLKGDLDNIVLRTLRKQPSGRYASVDQFSEDILRYLQGRPVQARGDAPLYHAAKFVRRNRAVVVVAGLLLCSLIGGLVEVTLARARADRRFNEVRQLAHSVLFDYADAIDRLPGSTPVRARLVEDALTYLDNLSKEADDPQLQREIVDAYVRVSNVQGNEYENNLGDTTGAMVSAQKGVAAAEKLLRDDRSPPALSSAADAFTTYGDLLYSSGDLLAVGRAYQRAIKLRQEIQSKAPQDLDNVLKLSDCLHHMGDLVGGTGFPSLGRTTDALAYYQQGRDQVAKLAAQNPENLEIAKENYMSLISLGTSEIAMGRRTEAGDTFSKAITEIENVLSAQPGDVNGKVELAIAEVRYGRVLLEAGKGTEARAHIERSAELLRALRDADPGNAIYRERQLAVEVQWADALRAGRQLAAALPHYRRGVELAQSLSHDSPASMQYRSDSGNSERQLSEGLLAAGDSAAAKHHADSAKRILCDSQAPPADSYSLANCGKALLAIGNADLALHALDSALEMFKQAEQIAAARSQADPANAVFRSDWARAQAALGSGLAKSADLQGSRNMYEGALKSWSILRESNFITAEDSHRANNATQALASLLSRR